MIRYRAQPLARWRTGKDHPCVVSVGQQGRVQSRTPIPSSDRAILALDPSANRNSSKPPQCILLLARNDPETFYTNKKRRTEVRLSPASGPDAGSFRPPLYPRAERLGNKGRSDAHSSSIPSTTERIWVLPAIRRHQPVRLWAEGLEFAEMPDYGIWHC